MRKKIIVWLLVAMMIFTLFACSESDSNSSDDGINSINMNVKDGYEFNQSVKELQSLYGRGKISQEAFLNGIETLQKNLDRNIDAGSRRLIEENLRSNY